MERWRWTAATAAPCRTGQAPAGARGRDDAKQNQDEDEEDATTGRHAGPLGSIGLCLAGEATGRLARHSGRHTKEPAGERLSLALGRAHVLVCGRDVQVAQLRPAERALGDERDRKLNDAIEPPSGR